MLLQPVPQLQRCEQACATTTTTTSTTGTIGRQGYVSLQWCRTGAAVRALAGWTTREAVEPALHEQYSVGIPRFPVWSCPWSWAHSDDFVEGSGSLGGAGVDIVCAVDGLHELGQAVPAQHLHTLPGQVSLDTSVIFV